MRFRQFYVPLMHVLSALLPLQCAINDEVMHVVFYAWHKTNESSQTG